MYACMMCVPKLGVLASEPSAATTMKGHSLALPCLEAVAVVDGVEHCVGTSVYALRTPEWQRRVALRTV